MAVYYKPPNPNGKSRIIGSISIRGYEGLSKREIQLLLAKRWSRQLIARGQANVMMGFIGDDVSGHETFRR